MNYRKDDRWPSYRFYSALQRQKSPIVYVREIFGAPRFSSLSTQSGVERTFRCVRRPPAELIGELRAWRRAVGRLFMTLSRGRGAAVRPAP